MQKLKRNEGSEEEEKLPMGQIWEKSNGIRKKKA